MKKDGLPESFAELFECVKYQIVEHDGGEVNQSSLLMDRKKVMLKKIEDN